jgi:hypothetical protein
VAIAVVASISNRRSSFPSHSRAPHRERGRPFGRPLPASYVTVSDTRSVVTPAVRSEVIRAGTTYTPTFLPSAL